MNTSSARTLGVHTVRKHPTLTFSSNGKGETRPREGDYTLFSPRWYRTDQEGILQHVGKSRVPMCQTAGASVGDWRLEGETLAQRDLVHPVQAFQTYVTSTVFFDLQGVGRWGEDTPMCFPPHASVHLEPFLSRTDGHAQLRTLGAFSPRVAESPEEFIERFSQLTGLDRNTAIIAVGNATT
jgi:hypothetical protein